MTSCELQRYCEAVRSAIHLATAWLLVFGIRALWRLCARMSKITNDGLTRCDTGTGWFVVSQDRPRVLLANCSIALWYFCEVSDIYAVLTAVVRKSHTYLDWCQNQRPWTTLNGHYALCFEASAPRTVLLVFLVSHSICF